MTYVPIYISIIFIIFKYIPNIKFAKAKVQLQYDIDQIRYKKIFS